MKKLPIIIITGPPCTGKSTLADKLSKIYRLPCFSKDEIKEMLFDSLGWSDREWSKKIGRSSYNILYYFAKKSLAVKKPFIMESNFKPGHHNVRIQKILNNPGFYPIQIFCYGDPDAILKKFMARAKTGQRHPGHVEHLMREEIHRSLAEKIYKPFDVGGLLIKIKSADCGSLNDRVLFKKIEKKLPLKYKFMRFYNTFTAKG